VASQGDCGRCGAGVTVVCAGAGASRWLLLRSANTRVHQADSSNCPQLAPAECAKLYVRWRTGARPGACPSIIIGHRARQVIARLCMPRNWICKLPLFETAPPWIFRRNYREIERQRTASADPESLGTPFANES
jgi:hypothetical protein